MYQMSTFFTGLGVFAKEFIPRGVKVGPYEGGIVFKEDLDDVEDTSYMWEVCMQWCTGVHVQLPSHMNVVLKLLFHGRRKLYV